MNVELFQNRYKDIKKKCKLIYKFDEFEINDCNGFGYIIDTKNKSLSKIDGKISNPVEKFTTIY